MGINELVNRRNHESVRQRPRKIDEIKAHSARSGKHLEKLGKWLVPQTKHYSWLKAADIIGIGLDQVIPVPVDHNYRMDINELEKIVRGLAAENTNPRCSRCCRINRRRSNRRYR